MKKIYIVGKNGSYGEMDVQDDFEIKEPYTDVKIPEGLLFKNITFDFINQKWKEVEVVIENDNENEENDESIIFEDRIAMLEELTLYNLGVK
ncbi:hypothetical protein ACFFIF_01995 [Vagococcus entomophilus]|uniref:Uncharacterized protein n=1 Tax=Vagococcus entomophilus TaxID=1160095 RepID=A0A430AJZ4_9ENTE|nr:hypothetical protein [Vagococcus entomophilus]RSU08426.1 hypothetical protein CBF30_04085 [Vagococcus entomophilus]